MWFQEKGMELKVTFCFKQDALLRNSFRFIFFPICWKIWYQFKSFLMELTWLSKEFLSSLMLEWLNWMPTLSKGIALLFCAFVVFLSVAISTSLICLNLICWLIVPKKYVNRFLGCFYLEKFCHSYPLSLINFKYTKVYQCNANLGMTFSIIFTEKIYFAQNRFNLHK